MKLMISHETTYSYDAPVRYALQQLRLTPKTREGQEVSDWNIDVIGGKVELEFDDHNNNRVHLVSIEPDNSEISIKASGTVITSNSSGIIGRHGGFAPLWHFLRATALTKPGPLVRNLVRQVGEEPGDDVKILHNLSSLIADQVSYEIGQTDTKTTAENALENGHGVCQDHTHVFLAAARLMGYPARYVSGYLMLNDRVDQDASHAWAEVHVDDLGWVGFDVSNRISPDERYVPVATGLDYMETAPVSGMRFGEGSESMVVSLQVQQ